MDNRYKTYEKVNNSVITYRSPKWTCFTWPMHWKHLNTNSALKVAVTTVNMPSSIVRRRRPTLQWTAVCCTRDIIRCTLSGGCQSLAITRATRANRSTSLGMVDGLLTSGAVQRATWGVWDTGRHVSWLASCELLSTDVQSVHCPLINVTSPHYSIWSRLAQIASESLLIIAATLCHSQ